MNFANMTLWQLRSLRSLRKADSIIGRGNHEVLTSHAKDWLANAIVSECEITVLDRLIAKFEETIDRRIEQDDFIDRGGL